MSGKADQIRLIAGKRYDTSVLKARLIRVSWTAGDGTGHEGYRWSSYFSEDGTYLGPDEHGIEPEFLVRDSDVYVCVELTLDELRLADPKGWSNWVDEDVHTIELCGYVDPSIEAGSLDLVTWKTNRADSKQVHDNWVQFWQLPPLLRERIARECEPEVIDDGMVLELINDLQLEIGTADLGSCRLAMSLAKDGHMTPAAMERLTSDPRQCTYTDLRSALIMLGCKEVA